MKIDFKDSWELDEGRIPEHQLEFYRTVYSNLCQPKDWADRQQTFDKLYPFLKRKATDSQTLIIIKPDAFIKHVWADVLSEFADEALRPIWSYTGVVPKPIWEQHYAEHKGKVFYNGLINFMCSGVVSAYVMGGDNAVERALRARERIRSIYVCDGPANLIHTSDSLASAGREIELWTHALQTTQS